MNAPKLKRSFTASLDVLGVPTETSLVHKLQVIDFAFIANLDDLGWLVLETKNSRLTTSDVILRFDLLDEPTQKFRITCKSPELFRGHRLDVSSGSYVGLYSTTGDHHWYLKVVSGEPGGEMVIQIYDQEHKAVSYFDNLYLGVGGSRPALDLKVADYVEF